MRVMIANVHLYDTCSHKCAYCHFADSGKVLDSSQIRPYKDKEFIDRFTDFFRERSDENIAWKMNLTGGEPLLMPNFERYVSRLEEVGSHINIFTALLVGENHPSMKFLLDTSKMRASRVEPTIHHQQRSVSVSYHPEADKIKEQFFKRITMLVEAGNRVILGIVAHPQRMHMIEEIKQRAEEAGAFFNVAPFYSPTYPAAYTEEEKETILDYSYNYGQLVGLEGGLDTKGITCKSGYDSIAVNARTGDISVCTTMSKVVIGNLYENTLNLYDEPKLCPANGAVCCSCPSLTAEEVVDMPSSIADITDPITKKIDFKLARQKITDAGFKLGTAPVEFGQTKQWQKMVLTNKEVKEKYESVKEILHTSYAEDNHPFYKSRQFPDSEKRN